MIQRLLGGATLFQGWSSATTNYLTKCYIKPAYYNRCQRTHAGVTKKVSNTFGDGQSRPRKAFASVDQHRAGLQGPLRCQTEPHRRWPRGAYPPHVRAVFVFA